MPGDHRLNAVVPLHVLEYLEARRHARLLNELIHTLDEGRRGHALRVHEVERKVQEAPHSDPGSVGGVVLR